MGIPHDRHRARMLGSRLLSLALVLTAACSGGVGSTPSPDPPASPDGDASPEAPGTPRPPRGPFEEAACRMPEQHLRRIWEGYHPERSGHLQIVPAPPDVVGAWLSHSGPWRSVQHVPLLFYGPGRVPEGVRVGHPSTLADVAPTQAALLGFDFDAPDGRALTEAMVPGARPPKLIVTMIWDSAGMNVLAEHPDAWPVLRGLMDRGTFFEQAFVGSSPSVTPAVHATIGTGAFPRSHGIVDLRFNVDGVGTAARGKAAANLLTPSLADLFDLAHDNGPVVGLVGSEGTLGMLGHGTFWERGDADVAVTRTRTEWFLEGLNAEAFAFPSYAAGFPGLEDAIRRLDLEDGQRDGRWLGEPMDEGVEGVSATPAFGEYQRAMVREVIEREGFGRDDVPDLLYLNYREIDAVGHRWGMHGPQMEAVVRSTDEALGDLVRTLDREVGEGEWVLTVTADHGATPDPEPLGGFVIGPQEVRRDIEAEFGPIVRDLRVTQIWLELEEMAERGISLRSVASFVADYRKAENASDPASLSAEQADERVFDVVFPSAVLNDPPCILTERGR